MKQAKQFKAYLYTFRDVTLPISILPPISMGVKSLRKEFAHPERQTSHKNCSPSENGRKSVAIHLKVFRLLLKFFSLGAFLCTREATIQLFPCKHGNNCLPCAKDCSYRKEFPFSSVAIEPILTMWEECW